MQRDWSGEEMKKKPKKVNPVCEESHTKNVPTGYVAFALWAEEKAKTHNQIKCKGCGHYQVWVKK